jgi:hypothetical protein
MHFELEANPHSCVCRLFPGFDHHESVEIQPCQTELHFNNSYNINSFYSQQKGHNSGDIYWGHTV